ncbi:LacI family DNA-binding transcriptional regulator [Allokutzneria albata]|uniref:DNA-binding transcriptional regulator, LacI/PurR family n=1 Tax=Allokutzneria albata TaxID=211114 RepID=A0A1G9Y315_ALLAB|nr:LacI family DNA-binding transcriptional regulator [Allokutzneria albata]SDN03056.1 DNA-binding transcriptional regulator, LacI/PurR family [Allokutzneria albata]
MRITRRVSQADIAKRAGVTQAAVSLILRDKATSIPEETRRRVLDVAHELGYRADPLARRLATGRSQLLGVFTYERVFTARHGGWYHPFLLGIEEEAERAGQDLLLFTSAATSGPIRSIYADGENKLRLVDAAVLLGRDEIPAELEQLVAEGYPFVFIGRRFLRGGREVPNVAPGYAAASQELADRLLDRGHRRISYLGSNPDLPATGDRLHGLREAIPGIAPEIVPLDAVKPSFVDTLLDRGVTAVVVEGMAYAEALRLAVEQRGLKVPDDLSIAVAGVAEDEDAGGFWAGFDIPGRRIGQVAVQRLLERLDGGEATTDTVECAERQGKSVVEARSR